MNLFSTAVRAILKPLKFLRDNLPLRKVGQPLGGINFSPYQNYPVSRSSHLSEISKHELVEPEH